MKKSLCPLVLVGLLALTACSSALSLSIIEIADAAFVTAVNTDANLSPATKQAYTAAFATFTSSLAQTAKTCSGNAGLAMAQCLGQNLIPAFSTAINSGAAGVKNPGEQAKINSYLFLVQTAIDILYQNLGQTAPSVVAPPVTAAAIEDYDVVYRVMLLEASARGIPERYIPAR